MSVAQLQNSYLNTIGSAPAVQSLAVDAPTYIDYEIPAYVAFVSPTIAGTYSLNSANTRFVGGCDFTITDYVGISEDYNEIAITISGVAFAGNNQSTGIQIVVNANAGDIDDPFFTYTIPKASGTTPQINQSTPFTFTTKYQLNAPDDGGVYPIRFTADASYNDGSIGATGGAINFSSTIATIHYA